MKLDEAKQILKKAGYRLDEGGQYKNFRQWYIAVADEIEEAGFDEIYLSHGMEDKEMVEIIGEMYDDGVDPKQAAAEVIYWHENNF